MKKYSIIVGLLSLIALLVLTLAALHWGEGTAKELQSEAALEAIRSELQMNLSVMENWNISKVELIKSVENAIMSLERDDNYVIYIGGIRNFLSDEVRFSNKELSVTYREVAFEASKTSDIIEQFEFNTVYELTRIYGLKHEIVDQYDSIIAMFNSLDEKKYTPENSEKIFGPIHEIQIALIRLERLERLERALNEKCNAFLYI